MGITISLINNAKVNLFSSFRNMLYIQTCIAREMYKKPSFFSKTWRKPGANKKPTIRKKL